MGIATHETSHEKAVAQIEERRRAEARAKLCKSRVSREPIPGKPDAHTVRVDGREVGLLRKHSGGSWTAVYLLDGADRIVADDDSQRRALHRLKVEVMLEDERRVAAELAFADTIARDLFPRGMASTPDARVDHNHAGAYGMADAGEQSNTIRGAARVQNTHVSIDDPRVDTRVRPDGNPPRRDGYGMEDAEGPASTVRGRHDVWAAPASTNDPRVETSIPPRASRLNGGRGVEDAGEPAHTVVAEGTVSNTRASIADSRVDTSYPRGDAAKSGILGVRNDEEPSGTILGAATVRNSGVSVTDPRLVCSQRADAYGVNNADQPSGTIVGHHQHDNVAGSVADSRVSVELAHIPQRGTMGVQASDEPSDVIRGNHSIRQAPGAVEDPRVSRKPSKRAAKPAKPSLPRLYNERGWPVATHYLVQLDDGRLVLYGPPVDFADPRPRADLVIVALDGTLHRPFTDAELALLMGFPLGFVFCGSSSCSKTNEGEPLKTGRRKRIGNAVPPPTAYAIAQECMATLIASANGGFRLASGDVWVQPDAGAIAA